MHRIALFIIITLIAEMAVSAFFHRNVSLLNQLVPPNDDFKKAFREGMFDKPNIAGFVQVTHYLLMIYDAERFRKLVEWPVLCKKTEAKYRNDVKENLNVIAVENPDIGFLNIVATYLHHANGEYGVISAPKSGLATDLTRTYLQQSKASFASNTLSRHRNCIQMERAVNFALEEEKEQLATIKTELFDKKQSVTKCITTAPVAASIKQCLKNVEDSEIIQTAPVEEPLAPVAAAVEEPLSPVAAAEEDGQFPEFSAKQLAMLADIKASIMTISTHSPALLVETMAILAQIRATETEIRAAATEMRAVLTERINLSYCICKIERICENISGIITNLSSDAKVLDGKQLEKINYSLISELPFPPDVEHCIYHLYNDNQLVYHNFIHLYTLILHQVYQRLRKDELIDLTQCQLEVEASVEDMKSMYNIFDTIWTNMQCSIEETQSVFCKKNMEYTSGQNVLPFINSVLLMPSPLIKINTNRTDETNNLQRLLQLTPGEIAHKSLFSRYKRIHTPDLRMILFVSRIDIDSAISLDNNDKQSLNMRFVTPKVNKL